jgi:hypothetical protein
MAATRLSHTEESATITLAAGLSSRLPHQKFLSLSLLLSWSGVLSGGADNQFRAQTLIAYEEIKSAEHTTQLLEICTAARDRRHQRHTLNFLPLFVFQKRQLFPLMRRLLFVLSSVCFKFCLSKLCILLLLRKVPRLYMRKTAFGSTQET